MSFFSFLDTTLKHAGPPQRQWEVDFEISAAFAKIARQNRVSSVVVVSSADASPSSRIFYSRMKGELERAIARWISGNILYFGPGLFCDRAPIEQTRKYW